MRAGVLAGQVRGFASGRAVVGEMVRASVLAVQARDLAGEAAV
ncbi:hypothetical protein [Streptomyces sp. NPDC087300]